VPSRFSETDGPAFEQPARQHCTIQQPVAGEEECVCAHGPDLIVIIGNYHVIVPGPDAAVGFWRRAGSFLTESVAYVHGNMKGTAMFAVTWVRPNPQSWFCLRAQIFRLLGNAAGVTPSGMLEPGSICACWAGLIAAHLTFIRPILRS